MVIETLIEPRRTAVDRCLHCGDWLVWVAEIRDWTHLDLHPHCTQPCASFDMDHGHMTECLKHGAGND